MTILGLAQDLKVIHLAQVAGMPVGTTVTVAVKVMSVSAVIKTAARNGERKQVVLEVEDLSGVIMQLTLWESEVNRLPKETSSWLYHEKLKTSMSSRNI